MAYNWDLQHQTEIELTKLFETTIGVIDQALGDKAFKPKRALNAAIFDSMMIGIAKMIESGQKYDKKTITITVYNGTLSKRGNRMLRLTKLRAVKRMLGIDSS